MSDSYFSKLKESLSPEDKIKYQKQGDAFFSNFDFKNGQMITPLEHTSNHIIAALKSGLTINDLDEDEKQIMNTVYGDDWMDKFQDIKK